MDTLNFPNFEIYESILTSVIFFATIPYPEIVKFGKTFAKINLADIKC